MLRNRIFIGLNQLLPLRLSLKSSLRLLPLRSSVSLHHRFLLQKNYSTNHKEKEVLKNSPPPLHTNPKLTVPKQEFKVTTREELLKLAKSFPEKIYIRLKWLLIRSTRPFNTDDFSAFFSWLVIGNVALFIIGTTTFFSLVLYTVNTVFAQEFVARSIGNFITKNSKLTVVFESAIVPSWRDSKILFKKCFVSRRPRNLQKFEKGSQTAAIAAAAAAALQKDGEEQEAIVENDFDDGNYTQFDLTIEEVSVSLSFNKWVNGKGILKEVEVKGMRGVCDRTHVHWEEGDSATNYKNISQPGDWEIENFKLEDVLITLMQPNNFRVFNFSIFNCDLPQLRKNWLFYDMLNANNMSGCYDDSLFTIHKKQKIDDFGDDDPNSPWRRVTRLRVDNLNVDHLNTGMEGPFGWISSGSVDMIGDIMVPEEENVNVKDIVQTIAKSIAKEATRYTNNKKLIQLKQENEIKRDLSKYFVLDLKIRLSNVRAAVPLFSSELSYVNSALIRPIVAYINSRKTYIAIACQIIKPIDDFDGSWTVYDSLLMDDISAEVYDAFEKYVADEQKRNERLKKIGFWSLQFLFQFILWSLGTIA